MPSLEQEISLPTSLSHDIAPHTSSPKDVTEDLLVYAYSPAPFNHSCELEVAEYLRNSSELDLSIITYNEHHDKDKSEAMSLHESYEEVIEPTILDFDDDILLVEYESFSCGFDINESFDEGLCAEYESFSLTPSKLTSLLNYESLNLSSLIILSL